jgi:hypothetical protein
VTDQQMQNQGWMRRLAMVGAGWGLAAAVGIGGLRLANTIPALTLDQMPGGIAFALVYVVPFVLAGLALRWETGNQGGVWLAAGLLGLMAMVSTFSGVTLIFFPAAILLILAGIVRLARNRGRGLPVTLGLIVGTVLLNGLAFRALFLREDARCWEQVRSEVGDVIWQAAPFRQFGQISATGNGVIGVQCASDVISGLESVVAVGLLAMEIGGVTLAGRAAAEE